MKVFSHGGPNDLKEYPLWKLFWIRFRGGWVDRDQDTGEKILRWGTVPLVCINRNHFSFNEGGRWITFYLNWKNPFIRLYIRPGTRSSCTFSIDVVRNHPEVHPEPYVEGTYPTPQTGRILTQSDVPPQQVYGMSAGGAA